MATLAVDVPYLVRVAQNSTYNWMGSLRPLRIELRSRKSSKKGCRTCKKKVTKPIDKALVTAISQNPKFRSELLQLKRRFKLDQLIVNVGQLRDVL